MNDLEKFRTRWMRWLGQKTRIDKNYFIELLDCNWSGWADSVLESHEIKCEQLCVISTRKEIKDYYVKAISCATMKELRKLDELYISELIKTKGW